ncbi:MAG: DUF512 domain-containing protein [Anaerolineae bacterium]
MAQNRGGSVAAVQPDSVGAEIGIEPGDLLLAINGHTLRDVIDYRYYGAEEHLILVVERAGERHELDVELDEDEDLGLAFSEPVFDGMRLCRNKCPFCFVRQMPPGMRRTLYLRDDDYRYSFLQGSFITLTNLAEEDWQRIRTQHLSPLYVSVHATDTEVRRRVLGNPHAPDVMEQLRLLGSWGIAVHAQIVVSPGVNDGAVLHRSVEDLAGLWPTVRTLAVVPVGLTRLHDCDVRLVQPTEAAEILDLLAALAKEPRRRFGGTWLYPSDELYLLAGRPVPEAAFYDDDAQRENGVGLVRALLDDWRHTQRRKARVAKGVQRITWVCGALIAPLMRSLAAEFGAWAGLDVQVVALENRLFGETVTVSGLLGGRDLLETLTGRDLGQRVFVPRAMFDAAGRLTLDNLTCDDLQSGLGVPVAPVAALSEVATALRGG